MNYGTAIEMALKIMETACIPAVTEDISEFSHGTHRAVDNDSHMIILVADKEEKEILENTFTYFDRIAKNCIKISVCDANSQNTINVPYAKETESVIAITTVIQIISTFVPETHGFDPNRDANNEYTEISHTRVSINRIQ